MKLTKALLLSALALFVAVTGCTVGPKYKQPVVAAPHIHEAEGTAVAETAVAPEWWKMFDDPVLDTLITKTLAANHDIRIAQARLLQARAIFAEDKFDRYPTVRSGVSYQRQDEIIPGFTTSRVGINTFNTGFDAAWEVDIFGGVRHQIVAASDQAESFEANVRDVQVSVVAELARNYFEMRGAQWRLDVANRSLENQRETLKLTELRRDAGVGEELDVASAAARVAATEATLPQIEANIHTAQNRLAVLTGVRPGELNADLSPHAYSPIAKAIPIGSPSEMLQRRPDVSSAERRLAASTELEGLAISNLFPKVSVSGFLGFLAGRGNVFLRPDSGAWSIAPGISWPAFDFGRVRAQVRGAKASTQEALAVYEKTVLQALEDTENAIVVFRTTQERLLKLDDQARESKRAADIARLRYREGVIDFLQLLDAERTQLQAEDAVAIAESESYVAVVALNKALGGL